MSDTAVQPKSRQVPLELIEMDPRFQVRVNGTTQGTVRRYATIMRSGTPMEPVTLARVDGVLVCVDGWHRIEACRLAGRVEINAIVAEATAEEAEWMAARANLRNPLPLSNRDLREVFRKYVKAGKHRTAQGAFRSYRGMERDMEGVKRHTTIRNWMKVDFPSVYRAIGGSDGHADHAEPAGVEDYAAQALDALAAAHRVIPWIKDPMKRGEVVAAAAALVDTAKTGGHWSPF